MPVVINPDACTNCGDCEAQCPVEAIKEEDGKRKIDPDTCTECEACIDVCPEKAIASK